MKKMMRDENLMKISEMADRSITDTAQASILLCYLLFRVGEPVEAELLYDIAVTGEIINFFTYQEALSYMLENGTVVSSINDDHETLYTVTESGVDSAKKLRNIAQKSYRDHIFTSAMRAIQRRRNQRDVQISYETQENGCYLHVRLGDRDLKLLELTLFTPDRETAVQLGERILSCPSALYHDVIQAVMKEHEIPVDLEGI